jgi:hypothetical protein
MFKYEKHLQTQFLGKRKTTILKTFTSRKVYHRQIGGFPLECWCTNNVPSMKRLHRSERTLKFWVFIVRPLFEKNALQRWFVKSSFYFVVFSVGQTFLFLIRIRGTWRSTWGRSCWSLLSVWLASSAAFPTYFRSQLLFFAQTDDPKKYLEIIVCY